MKGILWRLAVSGALALALSCGGNPVGQRRSFEVQTGLARVKAARAELAAARQALDRIRLEAGTGPGGESALQRAQDSYDTAYAKVQKTLSEFLNAALNDSPDSAETREALALYAQSAVESGRYLLYDAGDARRAVAVLEPAERCYRVLGLAVPGGLAATLAEARRVQNTPPTPMPTAPPRAARRPRR
jgi:hypothetical protein